MASGLKKLAGKVAVVTASSEGIGFAIARRLAEDGAKVMISSRKQQNVDSAVNQLKQEKLDVEGIVCHVGKQEDRTRLLEETVKRFGGIDVFVSNAACSTFFGPTLNTPEASYDKMFDVNVKSTFMLCKEVVPEMEKRGSGSILIVASIAAYCPFSYVDLWLRGGNIILISSLGGYAPAPMIGVYSITKTALLGLVKVLSPELAPLNIRVNAIAPGLIETKFSEALTSNETALNIALAAIPMGRLGVPKDCAGAASFLASSDSSFMTGETIVVSGGQSGRL